MTTETEHVIVYRGQGPWGSGKGSNLTAAEMDTNFFHVSELIGNLEDNTTDPYSISGISVANGAMTVTTADGRSFGPFALTAVALSWQGAYQPGALYKAGNFFYVNGNVYLVLQAFIAATTFDNTTVLNGKPIAVCVGGQPVLSDLAFFCPGQSGGLVFQYVAARSLTLQSVAAYLRIAPSADQVFTVGKNGVSVGSFAIASGNSATSANINASLATGDVLTVSSPLSPSGADLSVTLMLRRAA
jgi:hypothetical protein